MKRITCKSRGGLNRWVVGERVDGRNKKKLDDGCLFLEEVIGGRYSRVGVE